MTRPRLPSKDTVVLPLLLKRHTVPRYWLIWSEERVLVVHPLEECNWPTIVTLKDRGARAHPSLHGHRARLFWLPDSDSPKFGR